MENHLKPAKLKIKKLQSLLKKFLIPLIIIVYKFFIIFFIFRVLNLSNKKTVNTNKFFLKSLVFLIFSIIFVLLYKLNFETSPSLFSGRILFDISRSNRNKVSLLKENFYFSKYSLLYLLALPYLIFFFKRCLFKPFSYQGLIDCFTC